MPVLIRVALPDARLRLQVFQPDCNFALRFHEELCHVAVILELPEVMLEIQNSLEEPAEDCREPPAVGLNLLDQGPR